MKPDWTGVYPAITTKFKANGDLDLASFLTGAEIQLNAGVSGIIVAGSLGEASTLTNHEKLTLLAALQPYRNRIPVILNIAERGTREAVQMAVRAEQEGADGIMLLPPLLYRSDPDETVEYFTSVAHATSLPVLLYNNPVDYRTEISLPMFQKLESVRNIEAVKESTRDVTNIIRMRNAFGNRFRIMGGVDTLCLESLMLGADGLVAGLVCAFPDETVALYKLARSGRFAEAVDLYRWFMPLLELDIHPKLVQYIKLAESVTGTGTEYVRPPRKMTTGEERERILKVIGNALTARPVLPSL